MRVPPAPRQKAGRRRTGKAVLRDYINATVGFEALAVATGLRMEVKAVRSRRGGVTDRHIGATP